MWSSIRNLLAIQRTSITSYVEHSGVKVGHHATNLISSHLSCRQMTTTGALSPYTKLLRPWRKGSLSTGLDMTCSIPHEAGAFVPSRGMKVKGKVHRRCRNCKLTWVDGVLYNFCSVHPRHKQMLKQQYWPNLRILTSVSQTPKRPW